MRFFAFILSLFVATSCFGQVGFNFGLRAGISSTDIGSEEQKFSFQNTNYSLAVEKANFGYHIGGFSQIKFASFVIQPEVLFNSYSTDYKLKDFSNTNTIESIRKETYQFVDIPLMLAFKLGPLRLQGGPVGHILAGNTSELKDVGDYKSNLNQVDLGYQAGIGIDFWNLVFDFKYEGGLKTYGDHISFGNQKLNFSNNPNRLVVSVGFKFL